MYKFLVLHLARTSPGLYWKRILTSLQLNVKDMAERCTGLVTLWYKIIPALESVWTNGGIKTVSSIRKRRRKTPRTTRTTSTPMTIRNLLVY